MQHLHVVVVMVGDLNDEINKQCLCTHSIPTVGSIIHVSLCACYLHVKSMEKLMSN